MESNNNNFEEYPFIEDYSAYVWFILLIAALLLLFIILGITFSFYNHSIRGKKQPIETEILFQYSDINGSENGIYIQNAMDIEDTVGKKLTGAGNYFEFTVSGNPRKQPGKYMIVLQKGEDATIRDEDVKIYLTKVQGSIETEISSEVPVFSQLEDVTIEGVSYKKLHSVTLSPTDDNFSEDYILRMWIRDGASDYYGKQYSLKVNILAEGLGE